MSKPLREGYVQIHPERLAKLLALADKILPGTPGADENFELVADVRKHVRNKNQEYMQRLDDKSHTSRVRFARMSEKFFKLRSCELQARETRFLAGNTGRKIKVRWNGNERTAIIVGRHVGKKGFICADIQAIPSSPSYDNMTIDELHNAAVKSARIHTSVIIRDSEGEFQFFD